MLIRLNILFLILSISCKQNKLPILGNQVEINGKKEYPKIPDFQYYNQDSQLISNRSLEGKNHLACFFFTSCPTICPKVMRNMIFLSEQVNDKEKFKFLCFSLDFKRDSILRLKEYYDKVGINNPDFHLLRGNEKDDTKKLAQHYLSMASDDPEAPGGINHSGWILLIDKDQHIRAYADGTKSDEVKRLISDINTLLQEDK